MDIDSILTFAVKQKVSDVHITVGLPPVFRMHGEMVPATEPPLAEQTIGAAWAQVLTPDDTARIMGQLLNDKQRATFERAGDLDFAYAIPAIGRFRVNCYRQRGSVGMVIRVIPFYVPTFEELNLPPILATFARRTSGLVLVTGPTGSGKSTTLTAMIDLINKERAAHIITLEDPIEFLHPHIKSVVNQREVGLDTESFAKALRAAMRQDPDVLLVGEMRDLETISTAITAAETGHLVFATLHTNDAVQTIDRVIDVFPPSQQAQIRVQLAAVLQAVVSQQLIPRMDGRGRVVAQEILVVTHAVRNQIREGKSHQIVSTLQTGSKMGMQTMDMALRALIAKRMVTAQEAMKRSADPEAFQRYIMHDFM
ncbi:type IV pilus twitching motility protein PilT [Heliophilum fasciatum]|uniref:Twitching motility protein PilT n=1 Tax=Heliophilum fasciatum TaxID=35700 RepID=A0A4R2RUX0_9FIRM|nr:type IV pilus twitching motility protein PilT [Heliophilum fasciatum]MCW2277281.1 twitching motility protein PilT [Heliophilum fasciatum]TCP67118.1 twitching motility protein PilT [Heliophilum fasciatum]